MGGRARVEAVKTIVIEGDGAAYNLGQDMQPEASTQSFAITGFVRKIDLVNGRQRLEQTRTPKFAYFQGPQPQTQIQGLDGAVAFNVNPAGQATRIGAAAAMDRRVDFFHHPLTLLHAAKAPSAVRNVRTAGAVRQADITADDRQFTMTIDAAGVPLSISSNGYHANLGDVVMTTTFADYRAVNGVNLPARVAGRVDDFTTWETQASTQAVDGPADGLAAPAEQATCAWP